MWSDTPLLFRCQFQYLFDPETGIILEGPTHAITENTPARKVEQLKQIILETKKRDEEDTRAISRRRRALEFWRIGRLPSTTFEADFRFVAGKPDTYRRVDLASRC